MTEIVAENIKSSNFQNIFENLQFLATSIPVIRVKKNFDT